MKNILFVFVFLTIEIFSSQKIVPYINLVSVNNYSSYSYSYNQNTTFSYKKGIQIPIFGERWILRYPHKSSKEEETKRIKKLLEDKNPKLLYNDTKRRVYFIKEDNKKIYLDIYIDSDKVFAYEYLERYLTENSPIEVDFAKQKDFLYRADFDGEHFYTLKIDILEGKGANVKVRPYLEDIATRIRYTRELSCDSKYYKHYSFYNLVPYKAPHEFFLNSLDDNKTKISITLVKTPYTVHPIKKYSKIKSSILVKNTLSSMPNLKALDYIYGYTSFIGDYLPNKDAIFWVYNGYYTMKNGNYQTNLIPAIADKMTTVKWPIYLDEIENQTQEKNDKNLKKEKVLTAIYDANFLDEQTKVSLDFSLSHLPKDANLSLKDFEVLEAGIARGKPLSLERLHKSIDVVILLDSSGSMKKSMKLALESVKEFIEKLPKDAKITLVDFDTKVKVLKSTNTKECLEKLNKIRANGATALYDSIIKGIELLKDKQRASIVLFTDGKDANYNDTKRGSKATFDQMIKIVQEKKIPIYPIAFGKNADETTLTTIAKTTKTTYYQCETKEKLQRVFNDIANTLSTTFRLTYQRGKISKNSSTPTVNFMIDVSGSQDLRYTMYTDCEGCGYRFEQLKEILAKSFETLPKDTFIQLNVFNTNVKTLQIMTKDRAKLLTGIGEMEIGGGTGILKAIKKGYLLSNIIPSNRRYFIFLTDAAADAFKFNKEELKVLKSSLMLFKQAGIQTFWLGIVENQKVKKDMKMLADMSGGEYFVNSDINNIKDKILEITKKVETKTSNYNVGTISLKLKHRNQKNGKVLTSLGEKSMDAQLLQEGTPSKKVTDILYKVSDFNINKKSYNYQNSKKIYGDDLPIKGVLLNKIIPLTNDQNLTISAQNKAIKVEVKNAYIFDRLKGTSPHSYYEYLVLDLNITNILPKQKVAILNDGSKHPSSWIQRDNDSYTYKEAVPTYKIPNIKNHIFLRVNDSYEIPFYPLTWALQKPLTQIDEYELNIEANSPKEGVLLFYIPRKSIKKLSLHIYDTAYGHIDLPIIGELTTTKEQINKLPLKVSKKLSDIFSITILNKSFQDKILDEKSQKDTIFEVLHISMDSKINGLVNFNPKERFRLKIKGHKGNLFIPTSPITYKMPLGLYSDLSIAPGSHNTFALAFEIPKKFQKYPKSLLVELKDEDKEIILNQNKLPQEKENKALLQVAAKGITLDINNLYKVERVDGYPQDMVLVDMTYMDEKDSCSTKLHTPLYISKNKKQGSQKVDQIKHKGLGNFSSSSTISKKISYVDQLTDNRLLGCDNLVFDGTTKRCIALISLSQFKDDDTIYLSSDIFKNLKYELKKKELKPLPKDKKYMLTKISPITPTPYLSTIKGILDKIRKQKVLDKKHKRSKPKISLATSKEQPQYIKPLAITNSAMQKIKDIKNFDEALNILKNITWVPSDQYQDRIYSNSAILTQKWANEIEMTYFLYKILKTQNIKIEKGFYTLTDDGKKELTKLANSIPTKHDLVPFLKWKDKSIVIPFFKSIDELKNKKYIKDKYSDDINFKSDYANIKIKLYYKSKNPTQAMQIGGMSSALSGNSNPDNEKHITIFSDYIYYQNSSNMPFDIWFKKAKDKDGKTIILTNIYQNSKISTQNQSFKSDIIPKKLVISISTKDYLKPYVIHFKKGQKLKNIFLTFAFAMPDISLEKLKTLDKVRKDSFSNIKEVAELSQLQWANRAKIYRFLAYQSDYEKELEKTLQVQAKRNINPRIIISSITKSQNKLNSSLDLRYVFNDVYGDEEKIKSFNLMSGIFNSKAEEKSVPSGKDLFSFWKNKKVSLITILPKSKYKKDFIKYFKQKGASKEILQRFTQSDKAWLIPSAFPKSDGWIEIDPKNFRVTTVLKDLTYGSMAEYALTEENIETTTRYFLGLIIGSQIAVGSVIDYSLQGYESFETIKKRAHLLAKTIGCYVKSFKSLTSDIKSTVESKDLGSFKDSIESLLNDSKLECKDGGSNNNKTPKKYSDLVNFGAGIDHSIELYFKNMQ